MDMSWEGQLTAFPVKRHYRRKIRNEWDAYNNHDRTERADDVGDHHDKTEEHAMMRDLFARLGRIETFAVSFPPVRSDFDNGGNHDVEW